MCSVPLWSKSKLSLLPVPGKSVPTKDTSARWICIAFSEHLDIPSLKEIFCAWTFIAEASLPFELRTPQNYVLNIDT